MNTRIQLRRDLAADWTLNNPTLAEGEVGFELDTGKFKIGNGVLAWNDLGYASSGGGTGGSTVLTFSASGIINDKLYSTGWTADRNYTITKVMMRAGVHNPSHPDDGCPLGGPIYGNIRIYDTIEDNFVTVFESDTTLTVPEDTHKGTAITQMTNDQVDENETLAIKITKDETNTYTGKGLNITIVLEPR